MARRRLGEDDVNLADNKGIPTFGGEGSGTASANAEDGFINYGKMRARDQDRFGYRNYEPERVDELEKK